MPTLFSLLSLVRGGKIRVALLVRVLKLCIALFAFSSKSTLYSDREVLSFLL